jgi:hypothetical protein
MSFVLLRMGRTRSTPRLGFLGSLANRILIASRTTPGIDLMAEVYH